MSNLDRQIVNALDTLHREMFGGRLNPQCQWFYSGFKDIYHCPHTAIFGKDVIARIPEHHVETNKAQEEWNNTPESKEHQ